MRLPRLSLAEASALAARAATDVERLRRGIRLELATALQAVALRKKQLELFDAARVRATEETLRNVADEIEARRLPVREALLTQQSLIDYLFAHVEAQRQLCVASDDGARRFAGIHSHGRLDGPRQRGAAPAGDGRDRGLVTATLLTMFLLPVIYAFFGKTNTLHAPGSVPPGRPTPPPVAEGRASTTPTA